MAGTNVSLENSLFISSVIRVKSFKVFRPEKIFFFRLIFVFTLPIKLKKLPVKLKTKRPKTGKPGPKKLVPKIFSSAEVN